MEEGGGEKAPLYVCWWCLWSPQPPQRAGTVSPVITSYYSWIVLFNNKNSEHNVMLAFISSDMRKVKSGRLTSDLPKSTIQTRTPMAGYVLLTTDGIILCVCNGLHNLTWRFYLKFNLLGNVWESQQSLWVPLYKVCKNPGWPWPRKHHSYPQNPEHSV